MSQSRVPRTLRPHLNAEMHVCAHALGEHVYMYVCVDIDTAYTCTCINTNACTSYMMYVYSTNS